MALTEEEKKELVQAVVNQIKTDSQSVDELEAVSTLDGVVSLPAMRGETVVSAGFVTPYPPGFPVLVPGQVITEGVIDFMSVLDTREIHGYDASRGYRVLK